MFTAQFRLPDSWLTSHFVMYIPIKANCLTELHIARLAFTPFAVVLAGHIVIRTSFKLKE
jgi:hypothetical protein